MVMGISAVSITTLTSFPQMNREVTAKGQQAAKAHSEAAASYTKVSNFGNETKLGSSVFQHANRTIVDIGEQKTSMLMDRSKSYYEVSNFGNETKLGSSKFQKQIKADAEQGAQNLSKGMKAAADITRVSNFGTETKLGKSGFQQVNAQIMQARQKAYTQFSNFQKQAGNSVDIGA